jgi:DNA-binding winged helix-turn-helix (wHTH) protein/Tfp pilus assembly protein PilF
MGQKHQTFGAACMKSNIRFFRFGPFSLDAQERVLRRNGTRVNLQGQPYQILEVLLTRAGKLVTRDELRETLWPGDTYVDFEHGLNTSVKKLRLVLGDSAEKPSYIETVRGFGYRFVVSVEVENVETSAPEPTSPAPEQALLAEEPASHKVSGRAKRSSITALILAIAVLIAGGAFYLFRAHQKGKRLTENDTVVLADFANSTGDPIYDDTLKTALRASLRQSPFLNLLPDSTAVKTLQLMTRPSGTKLTPEIARELCIRAGSKAYIAGAIGSLGSEFVLGLKAVNCVSGAQVAAEQITAASKDEVLPALGKIATRLRGELGESLATVQKFDVPLQSATTPSLEALKAYSLGRKVLDEKGPAAAMPYRLHAIELDPNFAMAYTAVADGYNSLSEIGRAREYYAKAFQLRDRASEREKLSIAGVYYMNSTGELAKAAQTFQEEIDEYPRLDTAYGNLSSAYAGQGQYEKAAEVAAQAVRLNPQSTAWYQNLANNDLALQRFDQARQVLHEAQAQGLDDFAFHVDLYALAFFKADAVAMAEEQRWFAGHPESESFGLAQDSDTEAYKGHLNKARAFTSGAVASAVHADGKEDAAIWQANAAIAQAAFGNATEARKSAAEALKLAPASEGAEVESALALAMSGATKQAAALARELENRYPLDLQMQSLWLPAVRAQIALSGDRKNATVALGALPARSAVEFGQVYFTSNLSCLYPTYIRGEAYLAAGQGPAAAIEFQKILDHSGIVWNCWTGALAHLGVARANALQSRTPQGPDADAARVRALAAYKWFLMLWKDANPEIPILKEAKAEYAKLQ